MNPRLKKMKIGVFRLLKIQPAQPLPNFFCLPSPPTHNIDFFEILRTYIDSGRTSWEKEDF